MASYITQPDADTLAATLPGLASYKAATIALKAAALLQASDDIDQAMRYQGCKYGPIVGAVQDREFPRVTDSAALTQNGFPSPQSWPNLAAMGNNWVWDWNATTNTAMVPAKVQLACLYQADSILKGDREDRLQATADGLTQQGVGTMSEQYQPGGVASTLCLRAQKIMENYRLRSGRIL